MDGRSGVILVVGGAGYVGSVLVSELLERGYAVRVFDRLYYGDQGLAPVRDRIELVGGDMRQMDPALKKLHAHAVTDLDNPRYYNFRWMQMLEEASQIISITGAVFGSSAHVGRPAKLKALRSAGETKSSFQEGIPGEQVPC